MFLVPFRWGHLVPITVLIVVCLVDENKWQVGGRTWPRIKSYGKIYAKDSQFRENSSTTELNSGNSVLSEINPSPSPRSLWGGGTNDNGARLSSLKCKPSSHNESSSGWWTGDEKSCVAGPFSLKTDVNESVYNQLCPSPTGKFPVRGACSWFVVCHNGNQFTLNRCDRSGGDHFDGATGKCAESNISCTTDFEMTEGLSLHQLLERIVQFLFRLTNLTSFSRRGSNDQLAEASGDPSSGLQLIDHRSQDQVAPFPPSKPDSLLAITLSSPPPAVEGAVGEEKDLEALCLGSSSPHGLHAHPNLCSKYIQCGSPPGTFFLKSCGPGTVFNSELQICDWPVNVPHCQANAQSSTISEGNRLRRSPDDDEPPVADNDRDDMEWGPLPELMTRNKRTATLGDVCSDKENYIRPDPTSCSKYQICANSRLVPMTCGQGTLFNPMTSVCDFPDQVDCTSRRADFGTYGCDKGDSYSAPHPEACNKFVECDNGVVAVKSCPHGTLYDRESSKCEHAFRVKCRGRVSLEHDVDVNHRRAREGEVEDSSKVEIIKRDLSYYRHRRTGNNKLNLACEFNYIAPHPTSCTRFVECEDRRIYIKTCGPGTAFNPALGKCDWPHKIREADPADCTKFRVCGRSNYESRSCPPNHLFHPGQGKCISGTWSQIEQCSFQASTTTTSSPPVYVTPA